MGLEFISQPQVFTQRLTALGGIEGYVPPLWSTFYTWTSTIPTTANQLPLDGTNALTDYSGSYIVTVGGVLQSPTTYNIDVINRSIIFSNIINEDTDVVITQIGTIGLTSLGFQELSAVDVIFDNLTADNLITNTLTANELFVSNLTALSSVLHITDITTYEVSGFDVQGSINVQDDVTVGNTLYAYYLSADTAHITSPILSTDNSTQVATTNFVRLFGGFQNIAVYTSGTGTVNLSSLGEGIEKFKVTVVGGGGGGGASGAAIGATGSGGGSGAVTIRYIDNIAQLSSSFTYTVGAGGTGGAGVGGSGGSSSFVLGSVTVTANGGSGGNTGIANVPVVGGIGGTASTTGDINLPGVPGNKSSSTAAINTAASGEGGSNMFGGGAVSVRNTANLVGVAGANNTGGGGSGGAASTATNNNGGNGGSGVIIIEY